MKRVVLIAIAILACLALGICGLGGWWAVAADPLEETAGKLQVGMTKADVEKSLGEPPHHSWDYPDTGATASKWVTDRVIVMVTFAPDGTLKNKLVERRHLWDRLQDFRRK